MNWKPADSVLCTLGLIVEGRDPIHRGTLRSGWRRMRLTWPGIWGWNEDFAPVAPAAAAAILHDLGKIAVPDEILKKRQRPDAG